MTSLRSDILKTAELAFSKYGIRNVSVDDICNQLHISKKTFYTEFTQKEALIEEILHHISGKNRQADKAFLSACPEANAIDIAMSFRHPIMQARQKNHELFIRDLHKYYPEIARNYMLSRRKAYERMLQWNLQQGIEQGVFRTELKDSDQLLPLMIHWFTPSKELELHLKNMPKEQAIELFVGGYLRMVCNEKGMHYYEANYVNQKK